MPSPGAIAFEPPPGAVAYCRAARRVRGRNARRPDRLYRELRALAGRNDAGRSTTPLAPPRPCEKFAADVAGRLEGPVLRHAQRRTLLATARQLGIGRFEANLIIAAVQHERNRAGPVDAPTHHRPGSKGRFGPVMLVLALQSLIAWGAWRVVFG